MIEPVALSNFFLSFFTAAMIILTAALYAAVYAWGEITDRTAVRIGSLFVYALLLVCVVVFVKVANLTGYWQIVAVLMTFGYWWMPRFIWRLCVATHADEAQS
jgi:FlaA1/EpsC-like NDP-sugar epimerase